MAALHGSTSLISSICEHCFHENSWLYGTCLVEMASASGSASLVELARLRNSRVKGHHVFSRDIGRGGSFVCEREHINANSDVAIVAKRSQVIGQVPERLAKILTPMLEDGRLRKIDGWITGPECPVPEGTWSTGGGIELPCCYVLHGIKESRKDVRKSSRPLQ